MTNILALVGKSVRLDSRGDQEGEERSDVLKRPHNKIEPDAAAEPDPSRAAVECPASDPVNGELGPADVKANGSATDSVPEEQIDELRGDSALEVESSAGRSPEQSTGSVPEYCDVDATTVDDGVPEWTETYRGMLAAVFGEAQQRAEVELAAIIEQVRIQQAQQDAAEMASAIAAAEADREEAVAEALLAAEAESARVLQESDRRHAEELRQAREQVEAEATAAIDRVRSEEAERHATEVARVQKENERRRVDDFERARQAVVESFNALAGRIEHGVQG